MTPGKRAVRARRKQRDAGATAECKDIVAYIRKRAREADAFGPLQLADEIENQCHHEKED